MMDEIDFQLCLNIDQVLSSFHRKQQESSYPVHSNVTNSETTTSSARTRTHAEIEDISTDESILEQQPPAKKAKISPSGRVPDLQILLPNNHSSMDWTESSQHPDQYWGYHSLRSTPHMPFETATVPPVPPEARAASEEIEINYGMLYTGSKSDIEMETESAPEGFYRRGPLHPYGSWLFRNGAVLDGRWGSFPSKTNDDLPSFTIYEDPDNLEINGIIPSADWFTSPEEDKENIEDGYEGTAFLRELDANIVMA
ncbi:uncharacterized protein ACLA_013670 [Aspergillus clavatus NRRL 1]|uniref:Uncharacterized protein n=1 Tax=Aspergillus clavatus (strain ATCC 1007 / CBS 513.65 / DSM 816 / NCTC 3887 / NRRL 1 / QM 1276 / 107) TaxID=344612 RepID=A1CB12_ASPCL|nr:uncharacterized protein ACLA_013670 [Aspergillus clavatus NRRL 1]EAW12930.1 conserved hypothetical protein [Aspergillus clavatus NRRL 1]